MYDIFISYRRDSGSEFASFLRAELERLGYRVFFDTKSLREGKYQEKIDLAIDQCTFFLLLLAPGDLERSVANPDDDWILYESQRALERGKLIVPVSIRKGFSFPDAGGIQIIDQLSQINFCDLSGGDAAELIETKLMSFLNDHPTKKLTKEYNEGIIDKAYLEWEMRTLKRIYHDIPMVTVFGKDYPVHVIQGSESVTYPFNSLTEHGILLPVEEELSYQESPWYKDFVKIVGPNIRFPELYGFTNRGFVLDQEGKISGLNALPRTYKETVFSCHILQYELWQVYQKIGKERVGTLEDLPMRKAIHQGKTNLEVIMSGCNRSALNDVTIAVIDCNGRTGEYDIASAVRAENVATFPGYYSFIPSGGFELYELEDRQDATVIKENFHVLGALYREYIEELFGDEEFGKATGNDDLNRLYRNEKIRALRKGIRDGLYHFAFLGVSFDIVTLRQSLTFVLRIDDEDFFYDNEIKKNSEHVSVKFHSLKTLDEYIRSSEIPVLPETAATYALLMKSPIFREIQDNDYRVIDSKDK